MTDNVGNGDAPCKECRRHIWNIPILLDTKEPDGQGGFWYKVVPGGKCLDCGNPLNWFHEPGPDQLTLEVLENAPAEMDEEG